MNVSYIKLKDNDRKRYKNTATVALIVLATLTFSFFAKLYMDDLYLSASAKEKIFVIDAGHGGEDPGASTADGVLEKDLNLAIALMLGEMLENAGYTIVFTRTEDKLLYTEEENIKGIRKISDLKNRCKIADEYPEAIFLSIHMNSFGSSKYSGLQVYYGINAVDSKILANCIQANVKEQLQPENNRKVKKGNGIYIMENIENVAVLIECGFLSNEEESKKLSEKECQKILCFSIVCGIIEYMNSKNDYQIQV